MYWRWLWIGFHDFGYEASDKKGARDDSECFGLSPWKNEVALSEVAVNGSESYRWSRFGSEAENMQFSVNLLHFSHLHGNVKKKGEYNLTINGERNLGVGDP